MPISQVDARIVELQEKQAAMGDKTQVVVMCRRGNDSQLAAHKLIKAGMSGVKDLKGGLHAWAAAGSNIPVI